MVAPDPSSGLAPYAIGHDRSAGRAHAERLDPDRSPFHIDRQRVLQSTAFRRLEYKTQVFVTHEHDHFRTRLTHTLEVAEIARRLAVALRVNDALAETIALAHDLGHSPFGHAGEAALNKLMADHGGFEHNAQSLRVVDYLEHPFPPFRGLNLSLEVRHGLLKHESTYDHPEDSALTDAGLSKLIAQGPHASVEGQIASLADRLAYDCHDLEDALGACLIDEQALAQVQLWAQAAAPIRAAYPQANLPAVRRPVLNAMLDTLVTDAVRETSRGIDRAGLTTVRGIYQHAQPVVALSS
ncbi:MAG: dGTP triphosphohydrolase, partial [Phycisphaerae bacterium]